MPVDDATYNIPSVPSAIPFPPRKAPAAPNRVSVFSSGFLRKRVALAESVT
jgi:hypothetical protein